MIQNFLGVIKT